MIASHRSARNICTFAMLIDAHWTANNVLCDMKKNQIGSNFFSSPSFLCVSAKNPAQIRYIPKVFSLVAHGALVDFTLISTVQCFLLSLLLCSAFQFLIMVSQFACEWKTTATNALSSSMSSTNRNSSISSMTLTASNQCLRRFHCCICSTIGIDCSLTLSLSFSRLKYCECKPNQSRINI